MNKRQYKKRLEQHKKRAKQHQELLKRVTPQEAWNILAKHLQDESEKKFRVPCYFASYYWTKGKRHLKLHDVFGLELLSDEL